MMTNPQVKLKSKTNRKEILNVKGSLHKNKFDKVTFETSCKWKHKIYA